MQHFLALQATSPGVVSSKSLSRTLFEKQLVAMLPKLRAFALGLSRNRTDSDDLVQDTVVKALNASHRFEMGTSMQAWTFTILRNHWINGFHKRSTGDEELTDAIILRNPVRANQDHRLELSETLNAMGRLSSRHRDVLTIVRILGYDYKQTAGLMGCPIGTVKSRLNRADAALRAITDH